jgi:ABC-2 type transport system permease protein
MLAAAFLKRDFRIEVSYRLSFVWQLASLVFSTATLYFLSGMFEGLPPRSVTAYGAGYFPFAVVGYALCDTLWTCLSSFSSRIRQDQVVGTLEAMASSPQPMHRMVLCSGAYPLALALARLTLFLALAAILGAGFDLLGLVRGVAVLALAFLTFAALGLISASMTLVLKRGDPVAAAVSAMSFLFGGILYPVSALPDGIEWVASLLPVTYAVEAFRKLAIGGACLADVRFELMVLAAFAAAGIALAAVAIRWADRAVRTSGVRNY